MASHRIQRLLRRSQLFSIGFLLCISAITAQDFDPNLYTRCMNGFMRITVRTEVPFHGLLYAEGHREECSVEGTGGKEQTLSIPLTAIQRCGISYDEESEQYYALVHVREHAVIILQQDRMFNVSCPEMSAQKIKNESSIPLHMGVYSDRTKVHRTLFGDGYDLKISAESEDTDFRVTKCTGFSGMNNSLELTDYNGCSINSDLMSDFLYNEKDKFATATLHSMFKFPEHNIIHLQCAVVFCQPLCTKTDCYRRRDSPFPGGNDAGLRALTPQKLVQERFASTTVRVEEILNNTLPLVRFETTCSQHQQLLGALCILFGVLFLGALCVNCIFCALTGYCCCPGSNGRDNDSVEYVTTDLKTMDALNSSTVRPYPTLLYGQKVATSPTFYYHNNEESKMLTMARRRPDSALSNAIAQQEISTDLGGYATLPGEQDNNNANVQQPRAPMRSGPGEPLSPRNPIYQPTPNSGTLNRRGGLHRVHPQAQNLSPGSSSGGSHRSDGPLLKMRSPEPPTRNGELGVVSSAGIGRERVMSPHPSTEHIITESRTQV